MLDQKGLIQFILLVNLLMQIIRLNQIGCSEGFTLIPSPCLVHLCKRAFPDSIPKWDETGHYPAEPELLSELLLYTLVILYDF